MVLSSRMWTGEGQGVEYINGTVMAVEGTRSNPVGGSFLIRRMNMKGSR